MTNLVEPIQDLDTFYADIAATAQQGSLYALIDCAFDLTIRKALRKMQSIALYQETELADMDAYSPRLYWISNEAEIEKIITLCQGKPMLSFIRSQAQLGALKQHLEYLLKVYCEDNTEWPLRYADTRILPALFNVLNKPQLNTLLAPLHSWFILDRFGVIQRQFGSNQADLLWGKELGVLKMDEQQFAQMLDAATADSILATIQEKHSSILLPFTLTEQFKRVQQGIQDAHDVQLNTAPEMLEMALLQLMGAGDLNQSADYQTLKNKLKDGQDLNESINHLPASFWR
ncbi:DUF4123 domain-containing protein [Iodobacter sp. CM08]|uniref:DUF4123 domain-containing protein n=1 Tax=Iodobacter sp. CM08 TaxID=3085902 RepID=UPI002980C59E|nr:DUF4123 domain-containing protein [Iodobacter sp. CM08]MDW5417090.1 DUF4123 domain-containing protein [Iodobacter sp. CM08]